MGDAGPVSSGPPLVNHVAQQRPLRREVTVLVTGFGPFKSFVINPSFLIACRLSPRLYPLESTPADLTTGDHHLDDLIRSRRYPVIRIIVHPEPVRVSYATAAHIYPGLISQYGDPDFIFHIGMAGGRDHYALETLARRDGYVIKDVDDQDGRVVGEQRWKAAGLPEILRVGWHSHDVLLRWQEGLKEDLDSHGRQMVRLSTDAGKFLCEFITYESLALRAIENAENPTGKLGKVAFLHVPGPIDRESVTRGVRVAEAAIRALVESWEDGFRGEGFAV